MPYVCKRLERLQSAGPTLLSRLDEIRFQPKAMNGLFKAKDCLVQSNVNDCSISTIVS